MLEIQFLVLDRHTNVAGLEQLVGSHILLLIIGSPTVYTYTLYKQTIKIPAQIRFHSNARFDSFCLFCVLVCNIYIYIRLKIKPNSVRIRFLSCQFFVLPSTGFEFTPLIHFSTNRLALCPAP